ERAKKVIIYEIDLHLKEVLSEVLSEYSNYELIFEDFMKQDMTEFLNIVGGKYKVVANLPYYITTPIIFKFLENRQGLESLTIMVQKEVADRMVAPFNTANYGALSCMVNYYGTVKIERKVNRKMFYPIPNVDSAIIQIVFNKKINEEIEKTFSRLVKSAFAMRRKTFVNNLMSSFNLSREDAETLLKKAGFDVRVRGEALSVDDFIKLAEFMK
ncbi:MAG: 16S rRNA (adenine(1518)-N(6)/adenine(1519)-N(6))-dimethyltransferase RsmA, partial [Clostridia bacterium]